LNRSTNEILILGGGPAGLSTGYFLTKAGFKIRTLEKNSSVGGLSKTVVHNDFRFDLGGHRFFTKSKKIENFLLTLMGSEFVTVSRKSNIFLRNKYFDYPLKPLSAFFVMGIPMTWKIILDYAHEKFKSRFHSTRLNSLEDWIVRHFGRTLFNIFFKEYSEKVWGVDCSCMSQECVAQRIKGLSLGAAIRNAFCRFDGINILTLVDKFIYPSKGIGRISERLKEEIVKENSVLLNVRVEQLSHDNFRINTAETYNGNRSTSFWGKEFVSSIPLTDLVRMLDPQPPEDVLRAAAKLKYRDMVIVSVMLDRERVTDQSWIYIPEQKIPFGRIHEPKNWSTEMAPEGQTLLVVEYFCFFNDETWRTSDAKLADITIQYLEKLKFIKRREVLDQIVLRLPKAYPLLELRYRKHYDKICSYLCKFKNLHLTGRTGMFKYYNMDHALSSGMQVAERIMINSKLPINYQRDRIFKD